jgi:hypothetical protein
MRLRGDTVDRLERDLAALRETIAATERERARHGELAGTAAEERRTSADDPQAFAAATSAAREHNVEHDRLGFVLERRRHELAELETQLELARYEQALEALEQAARRRHQASAAFARALETAIATVAGLEAARAGFDRALAAARELRPDGVELELPAIADEVVWPDGADTLAKLVDAGPRRPVAREAAAAERAAVVAERRDADVIDHALRDAFTGELGRLERLRPDLRPRAAVEARRFAAKVIRESEAAARRGEVLDQAGLARNLARHRSVVERKLDRVLALLDAETAAAPVREGARA